MSRALHIPQFEVHQSPLGELGAEGGSTKPNGHHRLRVSDEAFQLLEAAMFFWKRSDEV